MIKHFADCSARPRPHNTNLALSENMDTNDIILSRITTCRSGFMDSYEMREVFFMSGITVFWLNLQAGLSRSSIGQTE